MKDLVRAANRNETKTLVVAVANDKPVLESVEMARKEGFIMPVLVGDTKLIKKILNDIDASVQNYRIIQETDPVEACRLAVEMVSEKDGHFLMKGLVDTSTILKAALNKEKGLRTDNRLSHVSVLESPYYHKLFLMTDGGMNIAPNVDEKQEIIENAAVIARAIGVEVPTVGCLAAIEKVNPKMQATLDAETLIQRQKDGIIQNVNIEGPFALDNAINKDAAIHKGITSPGAGDVDILLMPSIEAGNIFYKTMMFLAKAKGASVIAGAKKPIVLTSRADSKESKFYSIALSALVADL